MKFGLLLEKVVLQQKLHLFFCGSSYKNKGVQPLLDAVIDYLPAPTDVPAIEGYIPGKEDEEETEQRNEQ